MLLETVASCLCCESDKKRLLGIYPPKAYHFFKDPSPFYQCEQCGFIYISPRPSQETLAAFYSSEIAETGQRLLLPYTSKKPSIFNVFYAASINLINKMDALHPLQENTRLLDMGCGIGMFLFLAQQKKKFIAMGHDIGIHAVNYARKEFNLDVRYGDLKQCQFVDNYFDIIKMSHLLEHLLDAKETLAEVHRVLKPDGLLVIETPSYDSVFSKIFKENWAPLFHPAHLYQFTPPTMTLFLRRVGFKVIRKIEASIFPLEIIGSVLNAFDFDYYKMLKGLAASKWQRLKWMAILLPFIPVITVETIVLVLQSKLFNKGANMTVFAQKK